MRARSMIIPIALAVAAGGLASGGQDQTQPNIQRADAPPAASDDPMFTARNLQNLVYGVIKKVDPAELVCDHTEFGDAQPFKLDKKTKYLRDGQTSTVEQLKVGDKTWVKIRKNKKTGEITALVVVTGELPTGTKIR
ncbi:MAG TPA: hypothetical protein VI455_14345 [Terriglobia bacterium]